MRAGAVLLATATLACSPARRTAASSHEPAPPELVAAVRGHVETLAGTIGGRGLERQPSMVAAADYIQAEWQRQGYTVVVSTYTVDGLPVANLAVEIPGQIDELVLVGAHYDTCAQNPGADDNASGVAALLELSNRLAELSNRLAAPSNRLADPSNRLADPSNRLADPSNRLADPSGPAPRRTIQLVAFANEEPPHFKDPAAMGSSVHARQLRTAGREVAAMLSLESLGYFSDAPGSQHYPAIIAPLYPDTGDFIAVVGKNRSRPLVRAVVDGLERNGPVGVESIAAPATITGIDWSDHWSFWQEGWPAAVMITDTATYRNPHYHQMSDTPETLDYERLAWLVIALEATIIELADAP